MNNVYQPMQMHPNQGMPQQIYPPFKLGPSTVSQRQPSAPMPRVQAVYMEVGPAQIKLPFPLCSFAGSKASLQSQHWAARDEQLLLAAELQTKNEQLRWEPPRVTLPAIHTLFIQNYEVTGEDGQPDDRVKLVGKPLIDVHEQYNYGHHQKSI